MSKIGTAHQINEATGELLAAVTDFVQLAQKGHADVPAHVAHMRKLAANLYRLCGSSETADRLDPPPLPPRPPMPRRRPTLLDIASGVPWL